MSQTWYEFPQAVRQDNLTAATTIFSAGARRLVKYWVATNIDPAAAVTIKLRKLTGPTDFMTIRLAANQTLPIPGMELTDGLQAEVTDGTDANVFLTTVYVDGV